jgi:HD-GYP domain-containing protein (c-di-GMP phosphodiesterase class II)
MKQKTKYILAIIAAQTACVALALWVQHRFVVSSVSHAAEMDAWRTMEARLQRAEATVREQLAEGARSSDAKTDLAQAIAALRIPEPFQAIVLDDDGRILASQSPDDGAFHVPGATAEWTPTTTTQVENDRFDSGTLRMGAEKFFAVSAPLPNRRERLLLSHPLPNSTGIAGSLATTLPGIGVMTLLWTTTLQGVMAYMLVSRVWEQHDRHTKKIEARSLKRIQSLVRTRDAVIFGLAKLADSRDPETGDHLDRISIYASTMAGALKNHPKFSAVATPSFVRLIGVSSALHDIGKVGIEDAILRKPGKLTDDERRRMEEHTVIGGECLGQIEQHLGSSNFLQMAREIAWFHHECWDGTGYPKKVSGEAIPLTARIVAIADVYDALSSRRVYKPPFPHEKCVEIIRGKAGTHFDPDLVEVWLTIAHRFREIAQQYADEPATGKAADAPGHVKATLEIEPAMTS